LICVNDSPAGSASLLRALIGDFAAMRWAAPAGVGERSETAISGGRTDRRMNHLFQFGDVWAGHGARTEALLRLPAVTLGFGDP